MEVFSIDAASLREVHLSIPFGRGAFTLTALRHPEQASVLFLPLAELRRVFPDLVGKGHGSEWLVWNGIPRDLGITRIFQWP